MEIIWNVIVAGAILVAGLYLTISPEKAFFYGTPTKTTIIIIRIVGIVVLSLLGVAAFCFYMMWREGQLTF